MGRLPSIPLWSMPARSRGGAARFAQPPERRRPWLERMRRRMGDAMARATGPRAEPVDVLVKVVFLSTRAAVLVDSDGRERIARFAPELELSLRQCVGTTIRAELRGSRLEGWSPLEPEDPPPQ